MNTLLKTLVATAPAILAVDSLHAQMLAPDPVAKPPAAAPKAPLTVDSLRYPAGQPAGLIEGPLIQLPVMNPNQVLNINGRRP